MKTKKEIQETFIKDYLLRKKMFKLMPIGIVIGLAFVIVWYLCHNITYTNIWFFIAKYLFIAMGIGTCLTYQIMFLFVKIDLKKEKEKLENKIRVNKGNAKDLMQSIRPSSPLEGLTEEDIESLEEIKKIEQKILKLEAQLEMITRKG